MLNYIFYIISILFIVIILLKIYNFHLFNESLIFSSLTNYLLLFSTSIFFYYFSNYLFAFVSGILLLIFTIILLHDFKKILGYIPILSIPYLLINFKTLIDIILILL